MVLVVVAICSLGVVPVADVAICSLGIAPIVVVVEICIRLDIALVVVGRMVLVPVLVPTK